MSRKNNRAKKLRAHQALLEKEKEDLQHKAQKNKQEDETHGLEIESSSDEGEMEIERPAKKMEKLRAITRGTVLKHKKKIRKLKKAPTVITKNSFQIDN